MRQHLLPDPDAQPTPIEEAKAGAEAGWLRLSAALTREIGRLADRDDLIVQAAPGAGRGSPGCFVPALATIEVDGRLLPTGVNPGRARPHRPSDRERYPVLWGVLSHEVSHADHTRWQAPDDAPAATVAAAKLLEEPRNEARQLARRPGDRRWLRASATELVLEGEVSGEVTPWAAAQAAALVLGRVDAGVLDPDEAAPLTRVVEATLGAERLGGLREVWQAALETADDDAEGMLALGRRWCELAGADPDGTDPDADPTVDGGAGGRAGEPASATGAAGPHPSGREQSRAGARRSPIAEATRAVLAAVAANDDAEAAAKAKASAAASRRAAAKATEAARRRHAKEAAAQIFAPHTHTHIHTHAGTTGPATRASWTTRPPTPDERAAARRLARQLRAASHRDRATTTITSPSPPGRLRVRAALAADAQRAAGLRPTAEPWVRAVRRQVPSPPLRVGIAVDVSGSMRAFAKPLASAAWIMAQATAWSGSDATAATACFGERVTAVTRPGEVPARVRQFRANDGTELFCEALDALDGALGLSRAGDGARLLVVVSDGHYTEEQRAAGQARVRRLLAAGCGVLWIALRKDAKPMPGAQVALLGDPAAAVAVIGAAAQRALRTSP